MKGIISIIEVALTALVLIVSFLFFFPQYSIKTQWDDISLELTLKDTLYAIDSLNKTYDLSINTTQFNAFMNNVFNPQFTGSALVWWKDVKNITEGQSTAIPYFTRAHKETIIDVVNTTNGYNVYSFTLGLGFVF